MSLMNIEKNINKSKHLIRILMNKSFHCPQKKNGIFQFISIVYLAYEKT